MARENLARKFQLIGDWEPKRGHSGVPVDTINMQNLAKTVLETINHLLVAHPDLAPMVKEMALNSYGFNQSRVYASINELDKQLERYLDYDNGYFVELGANDGINQSNTLYFERSRNWRGILIEPSPQNYLLCKRFRGNRSKVYCNACVSFDYNEKFVELVYANLMTCATMLESDNKNIRSHLDIAKSFLAPSEDQFVFGAEAKTLNSILLESSAPEEIDLLSLDVEGAEIEVLKGVDHTKFRFKFLCIESRDVQKLAKYLEHQGYVLSSQLSEHDYLFTTNL